jgi:protein-disulfide isomerase
MKLLPYLLLCITAFAPSSASAATATPLDKAKLEAYLRHAELWVPQVNVKIDDPVPATDLPGFNQVTVHLSYNKAAKDEVFYLSKDGQKIFTGNVWDINKSPFQDVLDKLKTDGQPSYGGPADAPVSLVVFGDFECPFCKQEATILRQNIPTSFPGKVRVVFMDFPLDSIHPWARPASIAGRCIVRQSSDLFWKYHDWVYANQTSITPDNYNSKLMEWAGQNGVDTVQLGRCVDNKVTEPEVDRTVAMGRELGVDATPTLFLNGRKLVDQLAQWQALQQLIPLEIDHQAQLAAARAAAAKAHTAGATAAKAKEGDKCCTVEIPQIGK